MRTGNDIVAAGYMYGAATELVVVFKGNGVQRCSTVGEFIHTDSDVTFPKDGEEDLLVQRGNSLNHDKIGTRSSGSRRTSTPRGTSARW